MGRESREFLLKPITQQLNCKLFAFKMSDISNNDLFVGIKKLMVFEISCHQNIRTGRYGIRKQKASTPTAYSYSLNSLVYSFRMTNNLESHSFLKRLKESLCFHLLIQLTYHTAANILQDVI